MSAFILSNRHISYLVSYASQNDIRFLDGDRWDTVRMNEDKVFSMMLKANVESVNARYNETTEPVGAYRMFWGKHEAIQVLKAAICFNYQSCEKDDYKGSVVERLINTIKATAISQLPGYDEAMWDIPEQIEKAVK